MEGDKGRYGGRGRFLPQKDRRGVRCCRWLTVMLLVIWDGVLLYMIACCLIEPVYGAAFTAVISVYLGYLL